MLLPLLLLTAPARHMLSTGCGCFSGVLEATSVGHPVEPTPQASWMKVSLLRRIDV
jgi:hypothetical protein